MAFCTGCGNEIGENTKFCPVCGKECSANSQNGGFGNTSNAGETFKNLLNSPEHTSEFDPQDIEQNKIVSLVSYLGILFIIPLICARDSKFASFHVNQGILLFLTSLVVNIPFAVINFIAEFIGVFRLISFPLYIAQIILFAFAVYGIVNAVSGKAKELPFIGKYKVLK